MKTRTLKLSALLLVCLMVLVTLVGCGVSQSYADKINEAAKAEEYLTKEEVFKKLGDPTTNAIVDLLGNGGSGVATWISGVKTLEEAQTKLKEGKTLKSIAVTFLNGKATLAAYEEMKNEEDAK